MLGLSSPRARIILLLVVCSGGLGLGLATLYFITVHFYAASSASTRANWLALANPICSGLRLLTFSYYCTLAMDISEKLEQQQKPGQCAQPSSQPA
jgi:hypothetical protein